MIKVNYRHPELDSGSPINFEMYDEMLKQVQHDVLNIKFSIFTKVLFLEAIIKFVAQALVCIFSR